MVDVGTPFFSCLDDQHEVVTVELKGIRRSDSRLVLRLVSRLTQNRLGAQFALDSMGWATGLLFGTLARYDLRWRDIDLVGVLPFVVGAAALQFLVGWAFGLYRGRYRFGSFEEVAALVCTVLATTSVLFVVDFLMVERPLPLSATLSGGFVAFVLMGAARYVWRLHVEHLRRPSAEGRKRLLVFGAGEAGSQVITATMRDPDSPYIPVALLDDDHGKRYLRIRGIPVEGGRGAVAAAAKRHKADGFLIAIPSASGELVSDLTKLATEAKLKVTVLPPVAELFGSGIRLRDIRPVTEADLLGRRVIDTDIESIAAYLTGQRVLVTGAGGSIGSELCRQINRFGPAELMMLDRDESALHGVQLTIDGRGLLDSSDLVLCDIRDRERVRRILTERRPDVVFHAAALKHLPLLEQYPEEAIKTNIFGTLTMLESSAEAGVDRFVNISTDKAADPCSVLGYSKRICERLTAHFSRVEPGTYLSVRFGNVLGSRGSMLDAFNAQIAAGGPVIVTHPEVTRFFMTVQEAVQLVVQAGAIGGEGEVLIFDMGDPVRIVDVAERLIAQADRPIDMVFTGLRPGEKLHEALLGEGEADCRPIHDLISHAKAPAIDPSLIRGLSASAPKSSVIRALKAFAFDGGHSRRSEIRLHRSNEDATSVRSGREVKDLL